MSAWTAGLRTAGFSRHFLLLFALCLPLLAQTAVPTPVEFLGFEPGTDRKLASYDQVYAYFEKLAATSDRVRFSSIGKTTENHDLGFAIITSPKNLANLEAIRTTNEALVDPRKLKPGDAEQLVARGKTIVCLNASIHSSEVGPTQATMPLAHFLATTQDPEWLKVLDDVVLLMIPCHNPDGYLKQVDWYRKWVGTPHEGCPLPGLYHRYAGHDNNRDWFMFNLQETRLTVEKVYRPWVPQIVMDMHQMGEDGPRMFIPPYQDPIEPNVDPLLIERLNELGETVRTELLAKGLRGIVNRTLFDAWSPSRSYMHYHGGVRFLCEIASCRQASPIEKKGLARRAASRSESNPVPWSGERWALADIVRYHNEAATAVLRHASRNREAWIRNFHEVFRKACEGEHELTGIDIPGAPPDKFVDILELGGIEAFRESKRTVIPAKQPFFGLAKALLTTTAYPILRETETGPIRKPYDVTAHDLSKLMGFAAGPRKAPVPAEVLSLPIFTRSQGEAHRRLVEGLSTRRSFGNGANDQTIAIYQSFVPNVMDEGWLRLYFAQSKVTYRLLDNNTMWALNDGQLRVLVFPSLSADMILNGNRGAEFPPEYRGGIGDAGVEAIQRFVRAGGTVIALRDASALPIQVFRMPIKNALSNLPDGRRLTIPGAILRVYYGSAWPVLFEGGKAFEPDPDSDRDTTLTPYFAGTWAGEKDLLMGGYAEGLDLLAGKGAIVTCQIGKGQVILFGFSPHFRCQTHATFPLLANAIASGLDKN